MALPWNGFNAGYVGLRQNYNVCYEVTPANDEYDAETELMKALEETYMTVVGRQSRIAVEYSGKFHGSVDPDICLFFQSFVAPSTFVQYTRQTNCL